MSFKLKVKSQIFKVLETLPKGLGNDIYHAIQQFIGESSVIEEKISKGAIAYKLLKSIATKSDADFMNKTIIEIGSGWLPILPYFLIKEGQARRVYTYDINKHYNKSRIEVLNKKFFSGSERSILEGKDKWNLPSRVEYFSETDITKIRLREAEVVFSRYVLEHVAPNDIILMHKKFKKELPEGALIIHLISPSDHRAFTDPNLSLQDFLKYSEEEWQNRQTRFDYHNRLRLPQYLEIFKNSGLKIVSVRYDTYGRDSEVYRKFKKIELHKDFHKYSEEELLAGSINVVLKV